MHIAERDVCASVWTALEGGMARGQGAEDRAAWSHGLTLGAGQRGGAGHCAVEK